MGKGRLVFSTGPDVYLPIHAFGKEQTSPVYYDQNLIWRDKIHYHLSGIDFLRGGSLGYTIGLGYEKKLKGKMAIEFMPDFRVLNLVPFDFQGVGTHIYQNYIFNMALGLSTRLTFY